MHLRLIGEAEQAAMVERFKGSCLRTLKVL
jgi:hypothetical protein